MSVDNANLAALVGSRICHDLISPVGAIANGVELMAMSGHPDSPELDLIAASAAAATARLRFYRIAFGQPGQDLLNGAEPAAILAGMARGSRLQIDWNATAPVPRDRVRTAFLGFLCLDAALPLGGTITLEAEGADWRLTASGPRLAPPVALQALIEGLSPRITTAAEVQFALLPPARWSQSDKALTLWV